MPNPYCVAKSVEAMMGFLVPATRFVSSPSIVLVSSTAAMNAEKANSDKIVSATYA